MASASEAASPQTSTGIPAAREACVVASEKVRCVSNVACSQGGLRRLDHRPDLRRGPSVQDISQHLVHRAYLVRARDHRYQDAQFRAGAGFHDCGQLSFQGLGSLQEQLDSTTFDSMQKGRGFVAAEVEEANRRRAALESIENRLEETQVLRERGPRGRIEETQLGAKQAHTFGALFGAFDHLGHSCGVGKHDEPMTVLGLSRLQAAGDRIPPGGVPVLGYRPRGRDPIGVGPADEHACVSVQHHLFPVFDVERICAEPDDHGHPKRPSHDRRMRGDAAARQGDTLGVSRELGHVGGTKGGGDENTSRGVRSSPSGMGGCTAAETSHVISTQRERRISQVRQVRRDLVRRLG